MVNRAEHSFISFSCEWAEVKDVCTRDERLFKIPHNDTIILK